MGKHTNPGARRRAIVAVVIGVVVLLGAGAAYALTQGDSNSSTASGSTSTTSSSSAPSTSSSPPTSSTPSTTATPTADPLAAPLSACRAEVKAGDALARAAASSARDWSAHAGAEVSLDAGRISYAQAEKIWAASKKPGPADLAAFAAAKPAYAKASGGCRTLAAAPGVTASPAAIACVARSKSLAKVATTGDAVNSQWAAHLAQMKTKATKAGPAYHAKWMNFVANSKPVLTAYGAAASALAKAPACR